MAYQQDGGAETALYIANLFLKIKEMVQCWHVLQERKAVVVVVVVVVVVEEEEEEEELLRIGVFWCNKGRFIDVGGH